MTTPQAQHKFNPNSCPCCKRLLRWLPRRIRNLFAGPVQPVNKAKRTKPVAVPSAAPPSMMQWDLVDLNHRPAGYEPDALTGLS